MEQVVQTIQNKGYQTVAVQLPEGLKSQVLPLVQNLEQKTHSQVMVVADPCFGACDLVNSELKNMGVDCVVHIGHEPIPKLDNFPLPVFFVNAFSTTDVISVVEKALSVLHGKQIGVVTTAQHLHTLDSVVELLQKHHFKPILGEGDSRIHSPGQILGCNFSAGITIQDTVDVFLFIGSGMFHPLGLTLCTKKPVVVADPYTQTVKTQELDDLKDSILRQRYGAITAAKTAKTFGVLLSTKRGQQRIQLALAIKKQLLASQKKPLILALDLITSSALQGFREIDCFISTACPRIAIDDYAQYKKPILTPVELEIVLGKRTWDDYQFDQIP